MSNLWRCFKSTLWCGALLSLSCVLASCGGDEGTEPGGGEVGCRLNSDCGSGQICVEGDCVESDVCVGPQCPCATDEQCANGLLCDRDTGECFVPGCVEDSDCALGEVCQSGRCATDVDADRDRDGVPDTEDLCPEDQNADQEDNDGDGRGDACDDDDDDDGRSDTVDNCPKVGNPVQGDADDNGVGNACDEDTPGIDVQGVLDFSALPGANTGEAQVFVSGRDEAVGINDAGEFVFEDVLGEPGRFLVRVRWPGFVSVVEEFSAPDGQPGFEVPRLVMTPVSEGEQAVEMRGRVALEGAEDHRDIIVRARVGQSLVATTLTDAEGGFVLSVGPVDHRLDFSKAGYEPLAVEVLHNTQGELEGRFTVDDVLLEEVEDLVLERLTGQAQISVVVEPDWVPEGQRAVTVTVIGAGQERSAVTGGAPVVFSDLPAGDYIVFTDRAGFSQGRRVFTIDEQHPSVTVALSVRLLDMAQANLDLSGTTLTGADLRAVPNLRGANLAGTTLTGTEPDIGAELCNLNLSGASLVGADLTGANLSGASLVGARLDNATLADADLRSADLSGASLFGANLSQVDLRNGAFQCDGQGFEGRRTRLTGANLSSASLQRARFVDGQQPEEGEPCEISQASSPELSSVR